MKFKKRNIQVVDHSTGQTLDFPTFGKVAGEEAITELENNVDNKIADLKSMVGTPLKASTASAMNNSEKIYVYTGSESGYTNGHWYYNDDGAWVDGGVYNSTAVETDKTLSIENMPADAKKTGDEVNAIKNTLSEVNSDITANINSVKNGLTLNETYKQIDFTAISGSFIRADGSIASNENFSISETLPLNKNQTIRFIGNGYLTSNSMIAQVVGENSYIPLVVSRSSNEEIYEYTAENDINVCLCYDNNVRYKHDCFIYVKVLDSINSFSIENDSIRASMLSTDFEPIYYITDNKLDLTTLRHGRIIVNTGAFYADENYRCSQLIPCEGETHVYVWSAISTGVQAHSFVFYNASGAVIGYSDYFVKDTAITANAKYLTVTLMADQMSANPMITYKNDRPFEYIPFGRYIKDVKTDKANYMHLFNNIGIVGDSLSSGAIFDADGNHQDMHGYSWLANICRDINATPTFFSTSGLTTKAWLESEYKTALQSSATQFEAYYVALGTNDQNAAYGIGTIDDAAGTDSFVGYYKQIIDVIHTKAPNAVIFCVSMYNHDVATWSAMINSIANLYSYCYYIDFINKCETKLYIPNTRIYTPFVENWHYTGLGYIEVGHTIENVTNNVINENLSDFKFFTAGFFET